MFIKTKVIFYNEKLQSLTARYKARSPNIPSDKLNLLQPSSQYNTNQLQTYINSEGRNSPEITQIQQQGKHRRHIRSPTPIKSSCVRVGNLILSVIRYLKQELQNQMF